MKFKIYFFSKLIVFLIGKNMFVYIIEKKLSINFNLVILTKLH
jgi:hypothetical protein